MRKLLWTIPLLIVGIALASYQVYTYHASTTVSESIVVDDTNKIVLPESVQPGQIYCGSWTFVNHAVTGIQVFIANEISSGFSGNFTLEGNDLARNGSVQVEATPNITNTVAGCFTVKGDASGDQDILLNILR
jgi:hypothetical protein